jgi:hypothetical protein
MIDGGIGNTLFLSDHACLSAGENPHLGQGFFQCCISKIQCTNVSFLEIGA